MTPDTVVLIHGLWMTGRSWEHCNQKKYKGEPVTDYALDWALRAAAGAE